MGPIRSARTDPSPPSRTRDYVLRMPPDITVRTACEDSGCQAWARGWETRVDEATDLGRAQAAYIRRESGRTFTELQSGALTVFRFASRQRCFAEHRTRPARWLVASGTVREHVSMRDWVDDLGEHITSIEEQRKRG